MEEMVDGVPNRNRTNKTRIKENKACKRLLMLVKLQTFALECLQELTRSCDLRKSSHPD